MPILLILLIGGLAVAASRRKVLPAGGPPPGSLTGGGGPGAGGVSPAPSLTPGPTLSPSPTPRAPLAPVPLPSPFPSSGLPATPRPGVGRPDFTPATPVTPRDPYGILAALGATLGIDALPPSQRASVRHAVQYGTDPAALRTLAATLEATGLRDAAEDVKRAADLIAMARKSAWPGVRMLPDPQRTFALNTLLYQLNYAALYDPKQTFCERTVPSAVPDWSTIPSAPPFPSSTFDYWFAQNFLAEGLGFPPAPALAPGGGPSAEWMSWFAENAPKADVSKVLTKEGPPIPDPECAASLPVRIRNFVAGLAATDPLPLGALGATLELNAVAARLEQGEV